MKNKKLLPLVLLPLLLTSCGNEEPTELPNTGTALAKADGQAKFANSVNNTVTTSSDALGFAIDDAYVNTDMSCNITDLTNSSSLASLSMSESLSNGKLHLGVGGLTATNSKDVKVSLDLGATYKSNASIKVGSEEETSAIDKHDYSLKVDILENVLYLDLSNENTFNLVDDLVNDIMSMYMKGSSMSDLSTGISFDLSSLISAKTKFTLPASEIDEPLITESNLTQFDAAIAQIPTLIDSGEFRDHGDDVYSYSGKLTGEDLNALISTSEKYEFNFSTNTTASYAIIFDETGILSLGLKFDYKLESSVKIEDDIDEDITSEDLDDFDSSFSSYNTFAALEDINNAQVDMSLEGKFGVKLSLLRGDKVQFNTVDTSSFEESKFDFSTIIQ